MHIPTTAAPLPFTPPALGADTKAVFLITPQTQADYDRLGHELFRHNIVPMTPDTFRAIVIDELFKIFPEDEAEEKSQLLDEYWQAEDLMSTRLLEWQQQEEQRLLDEQQGAPKRPQAPLPERTMSVRRGAQATLLMHELRTQSMRLREATIDMQSYERKQREGMVRLVLAGWRGLETPFAKHDGIVDIDTWRAMRGEIGPIALQQLMTHILKMGDVDETERGNSDSPLASASNQNGSREQSGDLATSDGTSTSGGEGIPTENSSSSTSPVQPAASEPTTDRSSHSTSGSDGPTLSSVAPLMDAG